MEATVNTSCHARTLVQVISPAPGLLGCMYKVLGYLSGILIKVLARVVALILSLCDFLSVALKSLHRASFLKHTEVAEGKAIGGFRKRKAHERRHALFTGSTQKDIHKLKEL